MVIVVVIIIVVVVVVVVVVAIHIVALIFWTSYDNKPDKRKTI